MATRWRGIILEEDLAFQSGLTRRIRAPRGITAELVRDLKILERIYSETSFITSNDIRIIRAVRTHLTFAEAAESLAPGRPGYPSYITRRTRKLQDVIRSLTSWTGEGPISPPNPPEEAHP